MKAAELRDLGVGQRVEIADDKMKRKAERRSGAGAAVGTDDKVGPAPAWPRCVERARIRLVAAGENQCAHLPSLSIARGSCVLPSPA